MTAAQFSLHVLLSPTELWSTSIRDIVVCGILCSLLCEASKLFLLISTEEFFLLPLAKLIGQLLINAVSACIVLVLLLNSEQYDT